MKNTHIYSLLVFLITVIGYGQNENNHWVLGSSDVNFGTNPPVLNTVSNSGKFGRASVSDLSGNLLFYTDGEKIWNKNHQVMTNGTITGYLGADFVIQRTIIVPFPGNNNKFYVFISLGDSINEGIYLNRYIYSIVDFTNNNLGEVLLFPDSQNCKILKDAGGQEISGSKISGPLTFTNKSDDSGYWLLVQGGQTIYTFEVSSNGFNETPISSFTNSELNQYLHISSIFKLLPNNSKLGVLNFNFNGYNTDPANTKSSFCLIDFNNTTGQLSNLSVILSQTYNSYYTRFEFSNDSQNVYFLRSPNMYFVSSSNNFGVVVVKNLSNLSLAVRVLNDFGTTNSTSYLTELQRDKNGEILLSSSSSQNSRNTYLHKIDNQNSYSNSALVANWLSLNGNTVNVAYPNQITSFPQLIPVLQPCYTNLTISTNVTSGTDKKQASATITASNVISSGAGAIYHAGDSVTLTNGFHAVSGSTFRAYIEGCSNNYVGRISGGEEITEEITEAEIKLYPNPNSGIFTIDLAKEGDSEVRVYDTFGKQVYHSSEKLSSFTMNLSNLSAGLYIVQLQGKDYNKTIKFVKK